MCVYLKDEEKRERIQQAEMASKSWRDIKGKEVEEKQQEKITKEKEEKRLKAKDDSERILSSELAFKAWYVFYETTYLVCHIYRPSFRKKLLRGVGGGGRWRHAWLSCCAYWQTHSKESKPLTREVNASTPPPS